MASGNRLALDAADMLLRAANTSTRLPLLSGLLLERCASCFLFSSQAKKFCLHEVLAGLKIHSCGTRPARHAMVCFAAALLYHEKGRWGGIKGKLCKALADDMKVHGLEDSAQRSLLLLLKVLDSSLDNASNVLSKETIKEAGYVLKDIVNDVSYGFVSVAESWKLMTIHQILLGPIPVYPIASSLGREILPPPPPLSDSAPPLPPSLTTKGYVEICGLAIPDVDKHSLCLLQPVNGYEFMVPHGSPSAELIMVEELRMQLEVEKNWGESVLQNGYFSSRKQFVRSLVEAEENFKLRTGGLGRMGSSRALSDSPHLVPLGERLIVRALLKNRLNTDISLSSLKLEMNPAEAFGILDIALNLAPNSSSVVNLAATPFICGLFKTSFIRWNLSPSLAIRQSLDKEGPLLQSKKDQRVNRMRGQDTSMSFQVVPPYSLLHISFEGLSEEVLQGQLLKATLVLRNDGAAAACDIDLKLSQPCFVFVIEHDANNTSSGEFAFNSKHVQGVDSDRSDNFTSPQDNSLVPLWGQSCTVVRLPEGTIIPPGEQLRLSAWMHINDAGKQKISVLASYRASSGEHGVNVQPFSPNQSTRTSFVCLEVRSSSSSGALPLLHSNCRSC